MENNHVSKSEFKAKALEFFRQVEASGESLIVTNRGKPVLEVRPYRGLNRHPLDVLRGSAIRFDNPTDPIAADCVPPGQSGRVNPRPILPMRLSLIKRII